MGWEEQKGTARVLSDSKGGSHYVIFQEYKMSCGPASVAMAESQYKLQCMLNAEGRARDLSQKYEGKWTAEGGTMAGNLTYVLIAEGVKTYAVEEVTEKKLWDYIKHYVGPRTPVICHIAWTKGGHFAVCTKVYDDGTMVFLDPWYGVVEVKYKQLPSYNPTGATGKLSGIMNITYR